jgi:hypothetical protein
LTGVLSQEKPKAEDLPFCHADALDNTDKKYNDERLNARRNLLLLI